MRPIPASMQSRERVHWQIRTLAARIQNKSPLIAAPIWVSISAIFSVVSATASAALSFSLPSPSQPINFLPPGTLEIRDTNKPPQSISKILANQSPIAVRAFFKVSHKLNPSLAVFPSSSPQENNPVNHSFTLFHMSEMYVVKLVQPSAIPSEAHDQSPLNQAIAESHMPLIKGVTLVQP